MVMHLAKEIGKQALKSKALKKRLGNHFKVGKKSVPYRNDNQKNNTYPKL